MSGAADQRKVVAALRGDLPTGVARWTPPAIGKVAGLSTQEVVAAIQSLRFAGKMQFDSVALTPSMLATVETKLDPAASDHAAAAGTALPPPSGGPGHTDLIAEVPAARDAADDAGAALTGTAPASSDHSAVVAALIADIEAYLARTGMLATLFGDLALKHNGFVGLLRKRGTARQPTIDKVLSFMARWPDGTSRDQVQGWRMEELASEAQARRDASIALAPGDAVLADDEPVATPTIADEVKAEAIEAGARRRSARMLSATVHNPLSANVIAIQSAALEVPEDGFDFLRRRWPHLLRDVFALARAEETSPARMLARVVDAGVMVIVEDRREGLA